MRSKIAIEIGSFYTKIYKEKNDIVLYEPTLIIIKNDDYKNPYACGLNAEALLEKVPQDAKVIRPVSYSSIVNQQALASLLSYFIKKIKSPHELNPKVILSIQLGTDRNIIKQYIDVFDQLGIYNVDFIETPILALIGSNANLANNKSAFLIDLGYSQTTVCSLTIDGVISGASINFGGEHLDNEIRNHLEQTKTITFSNTNIEKMKRLLGGLIENDYTQYTYQGKHSLNNQLIPETITSNDIFKPIEYYANKILEFTRIILKGLPQGVIKDIEEDGIYLTGGCCHLYNLSDHFINKLGYNVNYNYQGELASIIGCGYVIEDKKLLNKIKLKNM